MKKIVIFNQKVAGYLMLNGFVIKKLEQSNKEDGRRNVFIFNDTEELRDKINKYNQFQYKCGDYFTK